MQRLVRDPGAEQALTADAQAWLAQGGLGEEDRAQLAAYGKNRLLVYRRHVRRTLQRGVRLEIPRTAARLGNAFESWVDRFIDAEAPRSQYFRDVAFEFVAWALPRWSEDASVPSYLGDLARHELAHFEVSCALDDAVDEGAEAAEITLDHGLRFSCSAKLFRYQHRIHLLQEDLEARDEPERALTALLGYRDEDLDVRWIDLTPLAAEILERLLRGETLGAAVVGGCGTLGQPVDAAVTQSTATLIDDLAQRGAILGGEA